MSDFADEDMAQVGRDLMEEIEAHSGHWPLQGWGPMDTPAEVVTDLVNLAEEMKARIVELEATLRIADDAITEMFRYYDGGETRGSYDGKPERAQLRKAGYAVRRSLTASAGEGK